MNRLQQHHQPQSNNQFNTQINQFGSRGMKQTAEYSAFPQIDTQRRYEDDYQRTFLRRNKYRTK